MSSASANAPSAADARLAAAGLTVTTILLFTLVRKGGDIDAHG